VGREDKGEKEKEKKKKRDCHVGPTCKKSRGSIVGTLAGVRRKKQAPEK
jgi:hypothetical protein